MIKYLLICFVFVFSISCKRCKECTFLNNFQEGGREEKCGEKLRFAEKNYVEGNGWKCE
jgi:hypothetical protein